MPACVDQELLLGGLVDGELDAANTALLEAHVTRCDDCREELERIQAVRNLLRGEGVRHRRRNRSASGSPRSSSFRPKHVTRAACPAGLRPALPEPWRLRLRWSC